MRILARSSHQNGSLVPGKIEEENAKSPPKNDGSPDPESSPAEELQKWTEAVSACSSGDVERLSELIERGLHVNGRDRFGGTLLHAAASSPEDNGEPCVDVLLDQGVDPNAKGFLGATPVHVAAARGNMGCLRTLLAAGGSWNVTNNFLQSPLHDAVLTQDNERCVQVLLLHDANPNQLDDHRQTPLHYAAMAFRPVSVSGVEERTKTPENLAQSIRSKTASPIFQPTPILMASKRQGDSQKPANPSDVTITDTNQNDIPVVDPKKSNTTSGTESTKNSKQKSEKSKKPKPEKRTRRFLFSQKRDKKKLKNSLKGLTLRHRKKPKPPPADEKGEVVSEEAAKSPPMDEEKRGSILLLTPKSSRSFKGGDTIRMLLMKGADPKARDVYGRAPVDYAKKMGYEAEFSLILHEFRRKRLSFSRGGVLRETPAKASVRKQDSLPRTKREIRQSIEELQEMKTELDSFHI